MATPSPSSTKVMAALTVCMLAVSPVSGAPQGAGASPRPLAVPTCPAQLITTQSVSAPPGWTTDRNRASGKFLGLTFYDGPVRGLGQLIESDQRRQGRKLVSGWDFDGLKTTVYMACLYIDTDIVLSQPLPPVKRCTVSEDTVTHQEERTPVCR